MHAYYKNSLNSTEARINAAIKGVDEPGAELSDIRNKYEAYLDWLDIPEVLCLRFEELILDRDTAMGSILDYLSRHSFRPRVNRFTAIEALKRSVQPKKSGTFRKGKPGNWREHFTRENIQTFKEQTGDLLVRLGYERDLDWS
jgi:hypothetical protein